MLSTKNVSTGGSGSSSKTLMPGNVIAKITSVSLEDFKFKPGSYHLLLHVEGQEMPAPFEGFLIDKDNPEKGRYKGQIGRVRTSEWAYSDGETKSGVQVSRDADILKAIKNICTAIGQLKWFESQDEKHATIEDFVQAFNNDAPFKDKWLELCLAAKEYTTKQGYTNYDLYLPKFAKGQVPYELLDTDSGKLIQYDASVHLKKVEAKTVENFGDGEPVAAKSVSKDFDI
jgi:hypothetical protein